MTTTEAYRNYSPSDREALNALRQEMSKKLGRDVTLAEAISAVEPDLTTPTDLAKI